MRKVVTEITLKEGVRAVLRCTPSVYGIAKERGIPVKGESGMDTNKSLEVYVRLAYCAAINEWEIQHYDHPDMGECPYTLADFDSWAWGNQEEFVQFVNFFIEALTGKSVAELVPDVKKKKKRRSWITGLFKHSS